MPQSKIDQVLKQVSDINIILTGNGTPQNGVVYQLARTTEKLNDHLDECKLKPKKEIFGVSHSTRDFIWKNLIRIGIIFMLGKEGLDALPK